MPRIETLPQVVADRIAAGEVVERPAAVAKELIENALDSGATHVTLIVTDAGRTMIRVIDDGAGMTPSDLVAAIGRHATSKLRRFEDLEVLTTFGFRGEALPSITAVSRLEITSRARGEEIGARLKVNGGVVETCEPAACPEGTSVSVSHLFHNVPARRKFLRSDATEFKWIAQVFRAFALAFPEIAFDFYKDDERLEHLEGSDARTRFGAMFGDDVAEEAVRIDHESGNFRIRGFITSRPMASRSADQFLFVNRRPVVSARLARAVLNGVEPYYTSGGSPVYMVDIAAPPDRFDINVHPAKKEVKFADENGVFGALWSAVRRAVGAALVPDNANIITDDGSITRSDVKDGPRRRGEAGRRDYTAAHPAPSLSTPSATSSERIPVPAPAHLTPFTSIPRQHLAPRRDPLPFPHNDRPDGPVGEALLSSSHPEPAPAGDISTPEPRPGEGPVIFQIFDTYLVSPLTTGLVFIDQHVAHERVLYERALAALERMPWTSQQLLFPSSFTVAVEQAPFVEELLPLLRAMGFEVEPFGPREFRILAVPAGVNITSERAILIGIVDEMVEGRTSNADPRQRLAAAFACRGAVKANTPLEPEQRRRLIDDLFQTEDPEFCPHGRPIYHVLPLREIEKWFKR